MPHRSGLEADLNNFTGYIFFVLQAQQQYNCRAPEDESEEEHRSHWQNEEFRYRRGAKDLVKNGLFIRMDQGGFDTVALRVFWDRFLKRSVFLPYTPDEAWPELRARLDQFRDRLSLAKLSLPASPTSSAHANESRLTFDDQTLTVVLDGVRHVIENPKSYALYKHIASVSPGTTTRNRIKSTPELKGL